MVDRSHRGLATWGAIVSLAAASFSADAFGQAEMPPRAPAATEPTKDAAVRPFKLEALATALEGVMAGGVGSKEASAVLVKLVKGEGMDQPVVPAKDVNRVLAELALTIPNMSDALQFANAVGPEFKGVDVRTAAALKALVISPIQPSLLATIQADRPVKLEIVDGRPQRTPTGPTVFTANGFIDNTTEQPLAFHFTVTATDPQTGKSSELSASPERTCNVGKGHSEKVVLPSTLPEGSVVLLSVSAESEAGKIVREMRWKWDGEQYSEITPEGVAPHPAVPAVRADLESLTKPPKPELVPQERGANNLG